MPKNESVNIANLEKSLKELKSKYGELGKFKILFLGILIGATISALIQLVILPFSFDADNTLRFGNIVLSRNVNPVIYSLVILIIFVLVIMVIVILYKRFVVGITPRKKVELNYKGDYKKIYNGLSKILNERCSTLDTDAKLKKPNDRNIFCYDKKEEENLLEIKFRTDVNILNIMFRPENRDSMALIYEIRKLYSKLS